MDPPSFSPPTCFTRIIDLDRDQTHWRFKLGDAQEGRKARHIKKAKCKVGPEIRSQEKTATEDCDKKNTKTRG